MRIALIQGQENVRVFLLLDKISHDAMRRSSRRSPFYLEQYRLRAEKREASDPLFLSEQRTRLTKNGFTQLFHRLCARAGLGDSRLTPTMVRDTFAIRFLQTGGPPKALHRLLGLAEGTPITRYLGSAGCSRRQRKTSENKRKA